MRPGRLALVVGLFTLGCGGLPQPSPPAALPAPSDSNVYLRSAMDADPSAYLGRFVRDDAPAGDIDEAIAAKTACSTHYRLRKVDAGGVTFDHYYQASTRAAAGLSIPQAAGVTASAGVSRGHLVRVRYELTDKWVADLADPAAFADCCRRQPDQCTGRVVGEFLGGVGTIYHAGTSTTEGGLSVAGVGVDVKDGVGWHQATEFGKRRPVFFAFKLTSTTATGAAPSATADDWDTNPPVSAGGKYFVGVSDWAASERQARELALADARSQVVRYLGERIREDVRLRETLGDALGAALASDKTVARASAGVARFVKDERWKPETYQGPDSVRYRAKVLAFIGNEQVEAAAAAVAGAAQ